MCPAVGLPVRTRLLTSSCWRCGARLNGARHGLFICSTRSLPPGASLTGPSATVVTIVTVITIVTAACVTTAYELRYAWLRCVMIRLDPVALLRLPHPQRQCTRANRQRAWAQHRPPGQHAIICVVSSVLLVKLFLRQPASLPAQQSFSPPCSNARAFLRIRRQHRAMLHNGKPVVNSGAVVTGGTVFTTPTGSVPRVCIKIDFKTCS